jgi:hypothetical protein
MQAQVSLPKETPQGRVACPERSVGYQRPGTPTPCPGRGQRSGQCSGEDVGQRFVEAVVQHMALGNAVRVDQEQRGAPLRGLRDRVGQGVEPRSSRKDPNGPTYYRVFRSLRILHGSQPVLAPHFRHPLLQTLPSLQMLPTAPDG